jgi:hypothetical protein
MAAATEQSWDPLPGQGEAGFDKLARAGFLLRPGGVDDRGECGRQNIDEIFWLRIRHGAQADHLAHEEEPGDECLSDGRPFSRMVAIDRAVQASLKGTLDLVRAGNARPRLGARHPDIVA